MGWNWVLSGICQASFCFCQYWGHLIKYLIKIIYPCFSLSFEYPLTFSSHFGWLFLLLLTISNEMPFSHFLAQSYCHTITPPHYTPQHSSSVASIKSVISSSPVLMLMYLLKILIIKQWGSPISCLPSNTVSNTHIASRRSNNNERRSRRREYWQKRGE